MCPILSYQNIATLTPVYMDPWIWIWIHKDPGCNLSAETSSYVSSVYAHQPFLAMNGAPWLNC